jgi:hypothetical protein
LACELWTDKSTNDKKRKIQKSILNPAFTIKKKTRNNNRKKKTRQSTPNPPLIYSQDGNDPIFAFEQQRTLLCVVLQNGTLARPVLAPCADQR